MPFYQPFCRGCRPCHEPFCGGLPTMLSRLSTILWSRGQFVNIAWILNNILTPQANWSQMLSEHTKHNYSHKRYGRDRCNVLWFVASPRVIGGHDRRYEWHGVSGRCFQARRSRAGARVVMVVVVVVVVVVVAVSYTHLTLPTTPYV